MGKQKRAWQETDYVPSVFGNSPAEARRSYAAYVKKLRLKGQDHRKGDHQGEAQGCDGQVLRRRHHEEAQAARASERGQAAHEDGGYGRGSPGGVHLSPPDR